jgi:glycosyltransferase involved in cell wall biosynthesis
VTAVSDSSLGAAAAAAPAGGELHVQLDTPLPEELAVGGGTALFIGGWCCSSAGRIRRLSFVVDGERQPVGAHGMPRLDVFRALHPRLDPYATDGVESDPASPDDPLLHGYRSGFWGVARIAPGIRGARTLALHAELDGGGVAEAALATIPAPAAAAPLALPAPAPADGPLVAICMATYEPPLDLLEEQLASIRAQTHRNWLCVISDDCSHPERFAAIRSAVADDPRFSVTRAPRRLGFYGNFERALALAPEAAEFVALADQDDRWHADKLATLLERVGTAQLVYSDARIVDRRGAVIAGSYWERRRNNHTDLLSLLVANSVTGAASCFRRELLADALPFPPAQFAHFHDHWLGLVALARGEIAFVDRPLYDYVQHDGASLGHAAANRMPALRERLGSLRRDPRERVREWRLHYFVDVARLMQVATVLRLRCSDRMSARKRATLDRFLRTDRSIAALTRLWLRGARELVGRPETLGAEWMLAYAFSWRRALALTTRDRPARRLRLDAVPPPDLAGPPRPRPPAGPAGAVAEKIAPLRLALRDDAPARVNLLIPTFDLRHFFGGYIAKLNLARRLAERGAHVRIVTVDPVGALPRSWARELESYSGLERLFERVEVAFGRESQGLEVSQSDSFVATTWWTAHIANEALRATGGDRFLYMIQEYEPFTFPMGSYAALADASYRLPHAALFSSELLRDYFRRHRIGVYAGGEEAGDRASAAFQNAITRIEPPAADELARRTGRRLLFYARPEPHAARNMFELGVLALGRALERGAFADGWSLHGIGTVELGRTVDLGGGASLELLPRSAQDRYARLLPEHDVGLALMYTPHPSLVPIEMASAGMLTVTNSFENKTAAALGAISPNLIAAEPTIEGVADALCAAAAAAGDVDRRVRGSRVAWSRDWDDSLDDELLARAAAFLEG